MRSRNITSIQLVATATLACLAGLIANTPAATALPEEVPAAIKQLNQVKVDFTKLAIPTVNDFEALQQETSATGLLTIEQPTKVAVYVTEPDAVMLAQSVAIPVMSLEAKPRTTDATRDRPAELLTVPLTIDAPAPSAFPLTTNVDRVGLLSHSTAEQFKDVSPLTEQQLQGVISKQLLLAREDDQETLCRLFPLNSRCIQRPAATDPAKQPKPSTTESATNTPKAGDGFYIGLSGSLQNREKASETEDTFLTFEPGLDVNAALGYRFGNFRVEGEVSFFNNPISIASAGTPVGTFKESAEGNVSLRAYMANLYYDIPIKNSRLKPYLGAGIGFYQSEINGLTADFFNSLGIPPVNATSNTPFAFQLRAGLGYVLSRKAEIYLGYRFFRGEALTFNAEVLGELNPNGANVHNVELGFRASF